MSVMGDPVRINVAPTTTGRPTLSKARTSTSSRFRPDIQGLRAVAVLVVVLHHAGVGWLPGGYVGVDVFFVISGFVITQSLLRGEHLDGISLRAFYAARARRILPMATIVLIATVAASWQLLNFVRAKQVITDALWSGFFAANNHFSTQGTDYFSSNLPPSPLQHYWSLAVEEQFYLVWPLLLGVLLFGYSKRVHRRREVKISTGRVSSALGLIIIASLAWSVMETASLPAAAYFSTLTRGWELAIGALLAINGSAIARVPAGVRAGAMWLGLAGIAAAGMLFTTSTPFPGYAALLPTLATAAVIAGGMGAPAYGAAGVLSLRPMQAVGNWSFSLYLWHWPMLVIAAGYAERDLSIAVKLGIVGAALALSGITYHLVENPMRKSDWFKHPRNSLLLWPVALATLLVSAVVIGQSVDSEAMALAAGQPIAVAKPTSATASAGPEDATVSAVQESVAVALANGPIPTGLTPSLDQLANDIDMSLAICAAQTGMTKGTVCKVGDGQAKRSFALIGDSHAQHWMPALEAIAKREHWVMYPFIKPGCTAANVTLTQLNGAPMTECNVWRTWALAQIAALHVDRVIVSTSIPGRLTSSAGQTVSDDQIQTMAAMWEEGVTSSIKSLSGGGAKVTMLSDVPGLQSDPAQCLLKRSATMATCTFPVLQRKTIFNDASARAVQASKATFIDVTTWFCAEGHCPTVIGQTVAYMDTNHISKTYALALADPLDRRLGLASAPSLK